MVSSAYSLWPLIILQFLQEVAALQVWIMITNIISLSFKNMFNLNILQFATLQMCSFKTVPNVFIEGKHLSSNI